MKVLFAVNNENISETIIKKYQQEYKEIISAKNVYYFNAIIKELQRDKTYDRIIISEDLQPVSNNNYDTIDKFIFDTLDKISDEATNQSGNDIPIILIATDRRGKSDPLLVKLFGIGVYNVLLGKDRSITNVCELLNHPRTKKEAKVYYRVDSEDVDYKAENEGDVSEVEIQNILSHYKKLGKNEEKYVESFDHIASQYTDSQLKLIIKFLPLNVKAVLEANSPKYQELVAFSTPSNQREQKSKYNDYNKKSKNKDNSKNQENNLDIIEKNLSQNKITEPVIIPSAIRTNNVKKIDNVKKIEDDIEEIDDILGGLSATNNVEQKNVEEVKEEKPAMPKASAAPSVSVIEENEAIETPELIDVKMDKPQEIEEMDLVPEEKMTATPKRRGRPKKIQTETTLQEVGPKRGRGRPKKVAQEVQEEQISNIEAPEVQAPKQTNNAPVNLFELGEEDNFVSSSEPDNSMILPGLEDDDFFMQEKVTSEKPDAFIPGETKNVSSMDKLIEGITAGANKVKKTIAEKAEQAEKTENDAGDAPVMPGFEDVEVLEEVEPANNNIEVEKQLQEQEKVQAPIEKIDVQNSFEQINEIPQKPIEHINQTPQQPQMQTPNQNYVQNNVNQTPNAANQTSVENVNNNVNANISGLMTRDKKVVAFLGTSKNGTSFLVNNVAEILSQKGINTAILDLTKNKNAYYIYTENEESLRNVAYNCISKLEQGIAEGIQVHKNLTVYTTLPGEDEETQNYSAILKTLLNNYSLVILDCDFETNYGYFAEVQELYLVQSMDVLTIQPLTAFLRNLKAKNVLNPEKIRIVLNKVVKLRSISDKVIIGGMAYYNDPAMSFMTELFNKDTVQYCTIPFEEQAYSKYLEALINCKVTVNGYSKNFIATLNKLGDMVYPLISNPVNNKKNKFSNYDPNANNNFSKNMNDTLNKMKNTNFK